jgi:hypothetical protein
MTSTNGYPPRAEDTSPPLSISLEGGAEIAPVRRSNQLRSSRLWMRGEA